jgi:hypothetical protein
MMKRLDIAFNKTKLTFAPETNQRKEPLSNSFPKALGCRPGLSLIKNLLI